MQTEPNRSLTVVVFSGDMDKLLATLSIASTAAAMGMNVTLFFTFWGISALRRKKAYGGKGLLHRILTAMLPSGPKRLSMSRKNMLGAGPAFFRQIMRQKNVANVDALVDTARTAGVRLVACSMSMEVMGLRPDELIDDVEYGGAATCVMDLMKSGKALFV